MKRKYGMMYNKVTETVDEVCVDLVPEARNEFLPASMCHEDEPVYQQLSKDYFQSVNIGARKNIKLHLRHIPTLYWKFLTENASTNI